MSAGTATSTVAPSRSPGTGAPSPETRSPTVAPAASSSAGQRRCVAAAARRHHVGRAEPPAHQQPVGVVGAVDAVEHGAVEVPEVLVRLRAQLDDVEVRVAADQRVERPGDLRDPTAHRPGTLVQLEGEADVPPVQAGHDPGDVAVQGILGRSVEEADTGADQPAVVERARHVVAGLGEGSEQLDGDGRVGVTAPDRGEQPHDALELDELGGLAHRDAGGEGCSVRCLYRLVRFRADQGQPRQGSMLKLPGSVMVGWHPSSRGGASSPPAGRRPARRAGPCDLGARRRGRARRRHALRRRRRRGRPGSACRRRR